MSVDSLGSQKRVGGFETNVHQAAVGHAFYAQGAKESPQLRRGFHVREAAGTDGVGSGWVVRKIGLAGESAAADGL